MKKAILLMAAAAALTGCATITRGVYQPVTIASDPPGAACRIYREGEGLIEFVPRTPEKVYIRRDFSALKLECRKPGYRVADEFIPAAGDDRVLGNVVTAGAGLLVDLPSQAHRRYPDNILVVLDPL